MMEIELQLVISWYQTTFSVVRLDHIQLWFWPKRTHGNLKTDQVVATTIFYRPQSEQKSSIVEDSTNATLQYEEELVPT